MNLNTVKRAGKRFSTSYLSSLNIQSYGTDNLYPQRMLDLILNSSTGGVCMERYQQFIEGNGYNDEYFSEYIVNRAGETVDDIHRLISRDMALYHGFALHVNYNMACQIVELQHVPFQNCRNTLGEIGINTGTDVADLNGTPYMDLVITLLRKAVTEMVWRIVWFADLEAKNVGDSGILTAGVNPDLFNMCNGLWKRLSAIIAAHEHQQTVITANTDKGGGAAVTYASQKEAIRQKGYALKLVDTLLSDADSRIFDGDNPSIYMTSSLFKALRTDVVAHYTNATMPFEQVATGLHLSEYDGVRIVVCDIWDRMIKKYEDTGTCLNNPHRAIVCDPSNLFIGTNDVDKIPELRCTFSDKDRKNYIYATSKIDTLVGEDALVQVAI